MVLWGYGIDLGHVIPTRRQLAAELVIELAGIDKKTKAPDRQLTELVAATGSSPQQPHGIGPPARPGCSATSPTSPADADHMSVMQATKALPVLTPWLKANATP